MELQHVALLTHARHDPCRHTRPDHRIRVAADNEERAIGGSLADGVPGEKLLNKTVVLPVWRQHLVGGNSRVCGGYGAGTLDLTIQRECLDFRTSHHLRRPHQGGLGIPLTNPVFTPSRPS